MVAFALLFCGFYVSGSGAQLVNNATHVVLMREGTRTVLSMQNNYEGPPEKFAMVVPVPVVLQKENVKTLPRDVFEKLDQLDSPRLVEYWEEDPCAQNMEADDAVKAAPQKFHSSNAAPGGKKEDLGVTIEAQFTVGEYEIVILGAEDSTGLDTWLKREKYAIPNDAEPVLRPYVAAGMRFFVAKVDTQKVKFDKGMAMLSPLRFHYDSEKFELPVRLGLLNAKGDQDLLVHILAKGQRYEVSNYANVTIPTNLDVEESTKGDFASVYNALFDDTLVKMPRAIVTEYAWDASTCDPCPGPALTGADLATFGADVSSSLGPPNLRGKGFRPSGYVITRLHTRYSSASLTEDLVFRSAPPIMGGREVRRADGTLERGAQAASLNNFQARYAIRHPWTGPIACANPVRGVWGGPPPGNPGSSSPQGAKNLAFAKRDAARLGAFKAISFQAPAPSVAPTASSAPSATPTTSSGGCGSCNSAGADPSLLGILLAVFLRRRKT